MRWIALACALVGCDAVFGLERVTPSGDLGTVTGRYLKHLFENDVNGMPQFHEVPYTLDQISADVRLDDGSVRTVTFSEDGTFVFSTATVGQAYALTIRTTFASNTYQLDATDLDLVEHVLGRGDRASVPGNTRLHVDVANRVVSPYGESLASTGVWTRTGVTNVPIDFEWANAGSLSGPLGLLDGAKHDAVFYAGYTTPLGYAQLSVAATIPDVTLIAGQTTTQAATASAVSLDKCVHVIAPRAAELARLAALAPAGFGSPSADWSVLATAANEVSPYGGIPLAYDSQLTDADQVVMFGNPFPGGIVVAEVSASLSRTIPRSSLVATLATVEYLPISALDCSMPVMLDASMFAVPQHLRVAGIELVTDDEVVTIDRTADVIVDWDLSASGRADYFVVTVFEIIGNTTYDTRQTIIAAGPSVRIDPSIFRTGHVYELGLGDRLGYPNFAAGDTRTTTMPTGRTGLFGPRFVIQ